MSTKFTEIPSYEKANGVHRVRDNDLRNHLGKREYARWLRWYREKKEEYEAYLVEQFLSGETNHIRAKAVIS